MKVLLVLCLAVVAVYGLPAKNENNDDTYDDAESFFFFPMRQHKKQVPSVVEVEVGNSDEDTSFFPYFRPFFINPFSFMNFGLSDFFSRPSWFDSLMPKITPDTTVRNSTSSTKVVEGHKITINDTIYENEKNGAVYRFQIIDVSPVDSKEKDEKTPEETTDKEATQNGKDVDVNIETTEGIKPDQNSQDNEIHREEINESYELQGDDPSVFEKSAELIDYGSIETEKREDVDLSNDIRVNKLLAENARRGGLFMIPPEVEVFGNPDYDHLAENYQQQEIVQPDLNQMVVRPEFNQQQEIVQPHLNQMVVRPEFNQQQV